MNPNDEFICAMKPGTRFQTKDQSPHDLSEESEPGVVFVRTENGWENGVWSNQGELRDIICWTKVEIITPPMDLEVLNQQIGLWLKIKLGEKY